MNRHLLRPVVTLSSESERRNEQFAQKCVGSRAGSAGKRRVGAGGGVAAWFSLVKCLETERGLVGKLGKAQRPEAVITHWSLGMKYDRGQSRPEWERLSGRLVAAHSAHLGPLSAGVTRRA